MSKEKCSQALKDKETALVKMLMTFNDQLNRLKVEELALTSLLRLQKEREMQAQTGTTEEMGPAVKAIEKDTMAVLNLLVSDKPAQEEAEEEEDDDEAREMLKQMGAIDNNQSAEKGEGESYNDQLASFLEYLLQQQLEQNQQEQLTLTPSQRKELEGDVEEEEAESFNLS